MSISEMLAGGDPRSLGRTEEVVRIVLADKSKLDELFDCLFSGDEIVRMRASDALEKVCSQNPQWLGPYKNKLLADVPKIKQPSVQWHLAQILAEINLNAAEQRQAIIILKRNLLSIDDWIVTNLTLDALATFTRKDALDRREFAAILDKYQNDPQKSVAARVRKLRKEFIA